MTRVDATHMHGTRIGTRMRHTRPKEHGARTWCTHVVHTGTHHHALPGCRQGAHAISSYATQVPCPNGQAGICSIFRFGAVHSLADEQMFIGVRATNEVGAKSPMVWSRGTLVGQTRVQATVGADGMPTHVITGMTVEDDDRWEDPEVSGGLVEGDTIEVVTMSDFYNGINCG